jgi:hypothetical protein
MKDVLQQFVLYFQKSEEFQQRLDSYGRFLLTTDGKFVKDVFLSIKGVILEDMLSNGFTKLSAVDKDVQQRAYHEITELMDFLAEPKRWVKQRSKIYEVATNLKDKVINQVKS